MGRYTLHDDPLVDATVEQHLQIIKDSVLSHGTPDALLLSGSFGRGEGSVYMRGPQVCFGSDYEIAVISGSPRARLAVDQAQRELADALPTSVALFWLTARRICSNRSRNFSLGPAVPTIHMYELKAAARVFFGSLNLAENPIDPRDLPVSEAVLLVENRMMEFMEAWSRNADPIAVAFSTAKMVLACADSLLLQRGHYHYSYVERAKRFTELFESEFAHSLGREFLMTYRQASSFKLRPFSECKDTDLLGNLGTIRAACESTLRALQCMERVSAGETGVDSPILLKPIPITFRSGVHPILDTQYENAICAIKCWRAGKRIQWGKIPPHGRHLSLLQLLYLSIPPLFFGIPLDGAPLKHMLEQAAYLGRWGLDGVEWSKDQSGCQLVGALSSLWQVLTH